jgi:hypothetical protein
VTVTGVYGFRSQTLLVQEVDKIQHQMLETPQSLIWNLVASLGLGNRNVGDTFEDGTKPWSKLATPIVLALSAAPSAALSAALSDLTNLGNVAVIAVILVSALWDRKPRHRKLAHPAPAAMHAAALFPLLAESRVAHAKWFCLPNRL